jgi:hypothetical protein
MPRPSARKDRQEQGGGLHDARARGHVFSFYYEAIHLFSRLWSSGRSDRLPLTRTGRRFGAVRPRESRPFRPGHSALNDRPSSFSTTLRSYGCGVRFAQNHVWIAQLFGCNLDLYQGSSRKRGDVAFLHLFDGRIKRKNMSGSVGWGFECVGQSVAVTVIRGGIL